MKKTFAYAAVLLLLGCSSFEPNGNEALKPPPEYATWWQEVEGCSNLRGSYRLVTWFVADLYADTGEYGHHQGHSIWLERKLIGERFVVAHEELHELLGGDPTHSDPAWKRCGL